MTHKYDLTTKQALQKLGCSQTKLTRLVNENKIRRQKDGKSWLYSAEQISCYTKNPKTTCTKNCEEPKIVSKSQPTPISDPLQFGKKKSWWKIWKS